MHKKVGIVPKKKEPNADLYKTPLRLKETANSEDGQMGLLGEPLSPSYLGYVTR